MPVSVLVGLEKEKGGKSPNWGRDLDWNVPPSLGCVCVRVHRSEEVESTDPRSV